MKCHSDMQFSDEGNLVVGKGVDVKLNGMLKLLNWQSCHASQVRFFLWVSSERGLRRLLVEE